jgi:hypothetical protein
VKVIDLPSEQENAYCQCLEEWSNEMKEAGNHKQEWYGQMKDKGLRAKLALDENETAGRMIQHAPIEHSSAEGERLCFVYCILGPRMHARLGQPAKEGQGFGSAESRRGDVIALGGKGLVAWGVSLPIFMRASWFKRHGCRCIDRLGMQELV